MRQTREILRHKWILDASHRRTVEALGISHGTITQTVQRALRAGLSWSAVCVLNDAELQELLYPPPPDPKAHRPIPDWAHLRCEKCDVAKHWSKKRVPSADHTYGRQRGPYSSSSDWL